MPHATGTPHAFKSAAFLTVFIALIAGLVLGGSLPAHAQGGSEVVAPQAAGKSFNSSFNGGHSGWSTIHGPWKQTASAYTTVGDPFTWSSIKHSGSYENFIYSARIKRTAGSNYSQGLMVRGSGDGLGGQFRWTNGYFLSYVNSGAAQVGLKSGGSLFLTYIPTTAIVPGDWNVLKIVAYDSILIFYINDVLVHHLHDPTFGTGSVGIEMLTTPDAVSGDKLFVDWAKLTVLK